MAVGLKGQSGMRDDYEEDVDDNGDGGFKDETIGYREGFRQPRNRRDLMYFDELLWQKKKEDSKGEVVSKGQK